MPVLSMTNITQINHLDAITLTYPSHTTHLFIISNIKQPNMIGSISLSQELNLIVSGINQLNYIGAQSLFVGTLTVSNILTQAYISQINITPSNNFPWASVGYPNGLEVIETAGTIRHEYPGYTATRARHTRMQKRFALKWTAMTSAQWLSLVKFWRSQYGGAGAFYFEVPLALYGAGSYGGVDGAEPADGFDAELAWGYGSGPTFLVRFDTDEMPQRYLTDFPEYWETSVGMIEVA